MVAWGELVKRLIDDNFLFTLFDRDGGSFFVSLKDVRRCDDHFFASFKNADIKWLTEARTVSDRLLVLQLFFRV